jgi:hypothetical protein
MRDKQGNKKIPALLYSRVGSDPDNTYSGFEIVVFKHLKLKKKNLLEEKR